MKPLLLSLGILISLASFIFVENENSCVKGNENVVVETRDLSGFERICLGINADLVITQSNEFEVKIEASENLMQHIKTKISSDKLIISSEKCLKSHKPIKVYVSAPQLNLIEVIGSGNVYQNGNWNFKTLNLHVIGSGDINFSEIKVAQNLKNIISGSGDISIEKLNITGNIENTISGSGDIVIKQVGNINRMKNVISGSGDVAIASTGICEYSSSVIVGSGNLNTFETKTNSAKVVVTGSGDARINVVQDLNMNLVGSGDIVYAGNPKISKNIVGSGNIYCKK